MKGPSRETLEAITPSDAEQKLIEDTVQQLGLLWARAFEQGIHETVAGRMLSGFLHDMSRHGTYGRRLRKDLARRREEEAP